MKRLLSVLLCLVLAFLTVGCTARPGKNTHGDIAAFLSAGQMPEAQAGLGASVDQLLEKVKASAAQSAEAGEEIPDTHFSETDRYAGYTFGAVRYYYRPDKKENGISCLVNMDTAYGFDVGTTTESEIEAALKEQNGQKGIAGEEELFFMFFSMGECQTLTYTSGTHRLVFYFSDGLLFATVLSDTALWD